MKQNSKKKETKAEKLNQGRRRPRGTESKRRKRKPPKAEPEVLTIDEVSKMLRVGRRAIYHLISNKKIPALKIGTKYRFYRKAIIDALSRID